MQKVTAVFLACGLVLKQGQQMHFSKWAALPVFWAISLKHLPLEKRAFCCFRFAGRFILSCKEVPLHAPVIKLCMMSGTGPCMQWQCKAYCISQVPIMLSVVLPAIMNANLPTGEFYPVWSTSPTWWALLRFPKPAFSWDFFQDFMLLKKYLNNVLQGAE